MPSDLEARIIRLEQLIPVVSRRLVKLRALNGQNLNNFNLIRAAVGDGAPTGATHTTSFCSSLGLPDTVTGTDSNYGALSLSYDGSLTFPRYSGSVVVGSYTSTPGGWWCCNVLSYPGYYGYPATSVALTYKFTLSGFLFLYWKTANPWNTDSQPITNTCGDINTSHDLSAFRTLHCPSIGVAGSAVFSIPGSVNGLYPSTGATITLDLPAL